MMQEPTCNNSAEMGFAATNIVQEPRPGIQKNRLYIGKCEMSQFVAWALSTQNNGFSVTVKIKFCQVLIVSCELNKNDIL